MFCAICTDDRGPFDTEKMDGRRVVVCFKCQTAPANVYNFNSSDMGSIGRDGVGNGNRRSPARGIGG